MADCYSKSIMDGDRRVYLNAWCCVIGEDLRFAASFKMDEPPGLFSGGEFIKTDDNKGIYFDTIEDAYEAANKLYQDKKN